MATITIRNIPEETHRELIERAARAGQSLQEYLKGVLVDTALRPDNKAIMARVRERKAVYNTNVSIDTILEALDEGRDAGRG